MNTPVDVVNFATTNEASKLVDAVNSILNRKAAEALDTMRYDVAQNIISHNDESNAPEGNEDEEV